MPSPRGRTPSRSSHRSVRVTSYRASDPIHKTRDSEPPVERQDRTAILARLKYATRSGPLVPPPAPTVTGAGLHITLPVPPSINHQYATVNGRRLLSSVGRTYKSQVGQQLWITLAQSPARTDLMQKLQSGPLALSIRFFFTSALRRDVDGGLKIAQDALCEGLGINDNRIVETHLYKDIDKANPRMEVSLAPA